jgi:YfiH family protein
MPTALTTDTLAAEHLTAPSLDALPGIRHGFFTRRGGVSSGVFASLNCGIHSGDDLRLVLNNRARVAATLRVARSRLVSPTQVHGAGVVVVRDGWEPGRGPEADALVTRERGLAIGVGTADCAPILFADSAAGVVGAAHAGWGGAFKGVIEATIDGMVRLGAHNGSIVAAVGPTIAQPSYEVGPEFRDRFVAADANNALFFRPSPRPGHALFDLLAYVLARLARLGLASVTGMQDLDTYADEDRFFSFRRTTHRAEKEYGRMISAIALA